MEKFKSLNIFQKSVLLIVTIMVVVFTIIYAVASSKEGFLFRDKILVPHEENGSIVYSGELQGEGVSFTVSSDKKVEYKFGAKVYGPYILKDDPTALPENHELGNSLRGVELVCGDEIMFRGGILEFDSHRILYNEDGTAEFFVSVQMSTGEELDMNGNVIDKTQPTTTDILDLMSDPELISRGEWFAYFMGVIICLITVIYIFFADELFRFKMSFSVYNVDAIEPSEWEIMGRYLSWGVLPIFALVVFVMGLQVGV